MLTYHVHLCATCSTYNFFSVSPVAPTVTRAPTVTHAPPPHVPPSASHSSGANIQGEGPDDSDSEVETEEDELDKLQLTELNRRFPARMLDVMANEVCL